MQDRLCGRDRYNQCTSGRLCSQQRGPGGQSGSEHSLPDHCEARGHPAQPTQEIGQGHGFLEYGKNNLIYIKLISIKNLNFVINTKTCDLFPELLPLFRIIKVFTGPRVLQVMEFPQMSLGLKVFCFLDSPKDALFSSRYRFYNCCH